MTFARTLFCYFYEKKADFFFPLLGISAVLILFFNSYYG